MEKKIMNFSFQGDSAGKLILRLTVGILMLFHGVSKVLNPGSLEPIGKQLASIGLPTFIAYGVYFGEVIAPLMIIFGVFSRIGGLIVTVNMIFAIVLVHTAQLLTMSKSGGWALELQGFYLFCGLAIFFLGSGKLAAKPD
jgi:putative oxidoreductase